MRARLLALSGLILGLVLSSWLWAAQEQPPPKVSAELAKAKVEAAKRTYDYSVRDNKEGRFLSVEMVYRWSRRWLEAEREYNNKPAARVAAYRDHLERMRDLEKITRERFRARFIQIEEVTATEFYKVEAQIWLAEAEPK